MDWSFGNGCLQGCVAKATTVEDQLEAVRREHNHAPNSAKCNAEKVVATIRKRAREEVETVPVMYMDGLLYATLKFKKLTFWELTFWGLRFWELTFWEVDILGVDILGVDILGVDILGS